MRSRLIILVLMVLCLNVQSQINTSFSFGSLGTENGSAMMFSGPVVVDGMNACMTLQNGINVVVRESSSGVFKLGCKPDVGTSVVSFTVYPNPSNDYVIIKTDTGVFSQEYLDIQLQDVRGTNLFTQKIKPEALRQGFKIGTGNLANGLYLIKVNTNKQFQTFKLIKTGNLQ